ncbi:MAG: hypothetical protein NC218_10720 [Acetobacter sp.]|nr:hypothetical protein [Acetobacter sp.]
MDYIDVRVLLSRQEPLSGKDAVEIINSWRLKPESYYQLLKTKGAAVPLRLYCGYSKEDEQHIFEVSDKEILSPMLALKFFELENDDLNLVLFETLNFLTFTGNSDDDGCSFYAWPYLEGGCAYHLSANTIENVLCDWNFVFDWEFDSLGSVYSRLYNRLLKADKCCDILAVNSFNLFNWLERNEIEIDVRAKHYCFANYSLELDEMKADAYFRKCLVHYLAGMWNNMEDIVAYIIRKRNLLCN